MKRAWSSAFRPSITRLFLAALLGGGVLIAGGCRKGVDESPPLATPSFSANHARAPLGSPLEVTYRFIVAPDARFDENLRVMVHFMDADEELMWTDDHNPPTPTTGWKPGQTIEYRRTLFVPIYPYIGEATVAMGLYSTTTQQRLPLIGQEMGQRSYRVGSLQLLPQTENIFLVYKDGWHPAEVSENNAAIEWQWTKKEATISFRNPKRNATLYLQLDRPAVTFSETQQLELWLGSEMIDRFAVRPGDEIIRKVPLATAQFGSHERVELRLSLDKTFIPALLPGAKSRDPRELGVRVFHAFLEPN